MLKYCMIGSLALSGDCSEAGRSLHDAVLDSLANVGMRPGLFAEHKTASRSSYLNGTSWKKLASGDLKNTCDDAVIPHALQGLHHDEGRDEVVLQ